MTRKIAAQDVKPGMEIEWKKDGWTRSGTIAVARETGFSQPLMCLQNTEHVWEYVGLDQEVTVLKEAQPEEPTAFGACVKAGEVRFFRINTRGSLRPWLSDGGGSRSWNELSSFGPVVIMCADPFATPAQDAAEPRKWDRWEDVPDMVAVRTEDGVVVARRNGDCVERLFTGSRWARSILTANDLNVLAPFMEVPISRSN